MPYHIRNGRNGWWAAWSLSLEGYCEWVPYNDKKCFDIIWMETAKKASIFAQRLEMAYCHESHPHWWSEDWAAGFMGKYRDGRPEFIRRRYGTDEDWPISRAELVASSTIG